MKTLLLALLFSFLAAPLYSERIPVVTTGLDVLEAQEFAPLKGKQIGLITNHTGRDRRGRSTIDVLNGAPGVRLIALFSPEHGIRGSLGHGQVVEDVIDARTHLPVYSLYGATEKPTPEMLNGIDVLVFDMQDVGARFYTYITTMALGLEAASQRGIEFVVLDRPNPVGGDIVEGEPLDEKIRHFTAYFSVPVRHGMTVGELAGWHNQQQKLNAKLRIIPITGWTRSMQWGATGLRFVAPSPNIRNSRAELLYTGIGMFETTNVSVGRGTDTPFEQIGAPWMNGERIAQALNGLGYSWVSIKATTFTPKNDLYAGKLCSGVAFTITDRQNARPTRLFFDIAWILRRDHRKEFQLRWPEVARVTGSRNFEEAYLKDEYPDRYLADLELAEENFLDTRTQYLLY